MRDGARIVDVLLEGAAAKYNGQTLYLTFDTEMTLAELTALLDAGNAPQIEMIKGGKVTNVYLNHALTRLGMESVGRLRRVEASMTASPKPETDDSQEIKALREELETVRAENKELTQAIRAIEEGIANA